MIADQPLVQEGDDGEPRPERERPRLQEEQRERSKPGPGAGQSEPFDGGEYVEGSDARHGASPGYPTAVHDRPEDASGEKQPDDLGPGDDRHGADAGGYRPQQRIALVGGARQLHGRDGDDCDDRRADSTEQRVDDRRPLVFDVDHGRGRDEQERRRDKRHGHRRRTDDASRQEAHPHRQLGGQRTGHRLGERESLAVLVIAEPTSLLDQVPMHVAHECDRSAEA